MTLWLVVWIRLVYDCPWGLSRAPQVVKDLACTCTREKAWQVVSHPTEAKRLVQESEDPEPLAIELRGARARQAAVLWEARLK